MNINTLPPDPADQDDEPILNDALQKRSFKQIFFKEGEGDWLDFLMDDAYVHAAKILLRNVIDGPDFNPFYGPVVLYLIRHYLETKLKLVCFRARWLRKDNWLKNADNADINGIHTEHKLGKLFREMQGEVEVRVRNSELDRIDVASVQRLVEELDRIDLDGQRFRYSVKEIKVHSNPPTQFRLRVNWPELLNLVEHCEQVLDWIDRLLLIQHGLNSDAEADMES